MAVIEVNEAFASVVLQFLKDTDLHERWVAGDVNPNGSGISLGHPLGATGARITATLLAGARAARRALRDRIDVHRPGPGHRGRRRAALSTPPDAPPGSGVVGRERELAALRAFLRDDDGQRGTLVLSGGPGIGKTTLWEAGVEEARATALRVLSARPSDAEARLVFAALIDLLDGVGSDELERLPAPQLEALEVALLRRCRPADRAPAHAVDRRRAPERAPRAVAATACSSRSTTSSGSTGRPRRRSRSRRAGWRATACASCSRGVRAAATALEQALEPRGACAPRGRPLSLGATRRLLAERLGLSLPRPVLRRIVDATLGNPLFALEVGRTLAPSGCRSNRARSFPCPTPVEDLLGTRVAALPAGARGCSPSRLSADLRLGQLTQLADEGRARRRRRGRRARRRR